VLVTAANVHDSQLLLPMLDSVPAIRTPSGRRRWRPDKLHADKAYDVRALRSEVRRRGIGVRIARKGIESSKRLGRHRWVVESCLSWLCATGVWSAATTAKATTTKPSPPLPVP
jgi:IS5 family transposase